jgi:DNA-binding SARP family transcriptional activator
MVHTPIIVKKDGKYQDTFVEILPGKLQGMINTRMVVIRLFGDFTLHQDGRLVSALDSARLQALLAYLLLHRPASQLRQHLAFLFWPDSDEAQARTNLRNLLHRLRQAWPEADQYLAIETRSFGWRPEADVQLDVAQFLEHLKLAQAEPNPAVQLQHLEQALALYRAELLPSCYDEWIRIERAQLHQAFLQALELAADLSEQLGDQQGPIQYALRLIQLEPLQEASYRRLMRLYVQNGDRAAALRAYHHCASILRRELDVAPDAETLEVYQRLVFPETLSTDLPLAVAPVEASLIGRSLEWEQLQLKWHQVAAGKSPPMIALIRGEAGVGKSRLAAELSDWVSRQGNTIATASCYAPESDLSFVPVISWLRAFQLDGVAPIWRAELARLLPELADQSPGGASEAQQAGSGAPVEPWQKRYFYDALVNTIQLQKQPLLLRLEDIQWSDAETLLWLHYLLRQESSARLMVVATLRDGESGSENAIQPLLAGLRQQGRVLEIELPPLDRHETANLAATLLGESHSPETASALHDYTEGNPLFIVETIRSSQEAGGAQQGLQILLGETRNWANDTPAPLPPKIQAVLRERLEHLSPQARNVLEAASVIGRSFTSEILFRAAEARESELVVALDELWRRRIIREREGDTYDFSHDKLRQAAYLLLSPVRRRWLHGRVAQALEQASSPASGGLTGRLAFHYEAAGHAQKALQYHRQAATHAQRLYAYQEACEHLQRAINLLDRVLEPPATSTRLYEQLGDVLTLSGRHAEARQAFDTASAISAAEDQPRRAVLTLKTAHTWLAQYELQESQTAFEEAINQIDQVDNFSLEEWRVWLDIRLGQLDLFYFQADLERMADLLEVIKLPLETYGSLRQRANAAHLNVQLESRRTRFRLDQRAVAISRTALQLANQSGDEQLVQRSRFGLGFMLLWSSDIEAAVLELSETAAASQAAGNIPLLDRCLAYLAIAHRLLGEVDRVRELLPRCQAVAESEGNALYLGVWRANQAWLDYREGKNALLKVHVNFALKQWEKLVFPFHWLACWPGMAIALQQADLQAALGYAREMLKTEQHQLPAELEALLAAAIAIEPDQHQRATELLGQAISLAEANNYL